MAFPRGLGPRARLGSPGRGGLDRRPGHLPGPLRGRGNREAVRGVLQASRSGGRDGFFDVLAHFDLPKKFGHRPETPRAEAERAAIAAAKEAGCAVEVSSAGLRKPVGEAYPEPRLLREIVEAGISVTFSSDAHAPAEVGWGFDRTLELARAAGAREYVTFAKRRPTAHPLP